LTTTTKYSSTDSPTEGKSSTTAPSSIAPTTTTNNNKKRQTPAKILKLRAKILAELKTHKPAPEVANILGISRSTVYDNIKRFQETGELTPEDIAHNKAASFNNRDWYKIIETTRRELPFYQQQRLVPSARKMAYRLIELAANVRGKNPNITTFELTQMGLPDLGDPKGKEYHEKKTAFIDSFYTNSAEARKGVDSTYTKRTHLPKLPLICFKDETREAIGDTDMSLPSDPTPAEPPDDPVEVALNAIQKCKDTIMDYDGLCEPGTSGEMPGKWYMQPIYAEIWCESETIQPDLLKMQEGRKNKVAAMKGFQSTRGNYNNCLRLKEMAEEYDYIKKIVILYFGDSDVTGNDIAKNIEATLVHYHGGGTLTRHMSIENDNGELEEIDEEIEIIGSDDLQIPLNVEVEFRHIAITPEQVKKYNLTGYQMEAFMTLKSRLKIFKKIVLDAIDACWDEHIYGENCPDEEFDYEANDMEMPEDIDPDGPYYDDVTGEDTGQTVREKMAQLATEAFPPRWEKVELERRQQERQWLHEQREQREQQQEQEDHEEESEHE
jgi:hypothetical protein